MLTELTVNLFNSFLVNAVKYSRELKRKFTFQFTCHNFLVRIGQLLFHVLITGAGKISHKSQCQK